jgi:HK97 gp10 family phage protein
MSGTTTISGLKELDQLMKQLPVDIEKKIIRKALREGQEVLAEGAKSYLRQNGSVESGNLEKSIRIRFKKKSERYGWIRSYVMAGDKKAYYAHMVEYGTGSYYSGTGNRSLRAPYEIRPKKAKSLFFAGVTRTIITHPGSKPQPFMRPAVDNYTDAAINAVVAYMQKRIPKEIKKAKL